MPAGQRRPRADARGRPRGRSVPADRERRCRAAAPLPLAAGVQPRAAARSTRREGPSGRLQGRRAAPSETCRIRVSCAVLRTPVHADGSLSFRGERVFVSDAVAGHAIGLEPIDALRFRAWFRDVDLGELEMLADVSDSRCGRITESRRASSSRPATSLHAGACRLRRRLPPLCSRTNCSIVDALVLAKVEIGSEVELQGRWTDRLSTTPTELSAISCPVPGRDRNRSRSRSQGWGAQCGGKIARDPQTLSRVIEDADR